MNPSKKVRKALNTIEVIKKDYIEYFMANNPEAYYECLQLFKEVEDTLVTLSIGKRTIECELAKKIKDEV